MAGSGDHWDQRPADAALSVAPAGVLLHRDGSWHRLTAPSLERMEKELRAALAAYNLVRTGTCVAAREAHLNPRRWSFSPVLDRVNAFGPDLLSDPVSAPGKRELPQLIRLAGRRQLPQRCHPCSYRRAVGARGYRYPERQETNSQSK